MAIFEELNQHELLFQHCELLPRDKQLELYDTLGQKALLKNKINKALEYFRLSGN